MNNKKTLNFPVITVYTVLLAALCAAAELIFLRTPVPEGLVSIGQGLAGTGFSVAVIAVSILAVITNISDRRFFGITAGEYLKFRRRKLEPGFYDVLVIIVLLGSLQYAALAFDARYAAAAAFVEIIALMIIQIKWGLGIAFFYYDKEKQIRAFLTAEIDSNLKTVANEKAHKKRRERAQLYVTSRIDNLFAHTKNAVSKKEMTQVADNLSLMAYILGQLLGNEYQSVWRNFETRLDSLIASIIPDDELSEYAVNSVSRMMDEILATKESDDKQIAMNCDFDRTRVESYKMLGFSHPRLLEHMFDRALFYKLAAVKIYGIKSVERKAQRYALYTGQFAKSAAASEHKEEIEQMIIGSMRKLAPLCFVDGKAQETAIYFITLGRALEENGMKTGGLWEEAEEKEEKTQEQKRSMCLIKYAAGEKADCGLSEQDKKETDEFVKMLDSCV